MLAKEVRRLLQSKSKASSQLKFQTIFEEVKEHSQVVSCGHLIRGAEGDH